MMNIIKWFKFKARNKILPCSKFGYCIYEYDQESDREIEGMPFVDNDKRSCPDYGHICPKFMEDFNLTVEDLRIRATIHCGSLIDELIKNGQVNKDSDQVIELKKRYEETIKKYPVEQYPNYY